MKHQDQHSIQQVNHNSSNNRGFKNDPCRPIRSLDSASLHHLIQTQTVVQTVQILLSISIFRAAGTRWERCEEEKCEGDGLERRLQPSVLGDFGLTAVISGSAKTTAPSRKLLSLIQVLDGRIHLDPPQAADARELDFQWPPVSSCDEWTLFLFFVKPHLCCCCIVVSFLLFRVTIKLTGLFTQSWFVQETTLGSQWEASCPVWAEKEKRVVSTIPLSVSNQLVWWSNYL